MPARRALMSLAAILFVSPLFVHATPLPPTTPAVYTFTVIGSGSLDGVAFTDALLTFTADTTLASVSTSSTNANLDRASNLLVTVSVASGGSDTLTNNIRFSVNRGSSQTAGITDVTQVLGVLVLQDSAFSGVSMFDSAGPVAAVAVNTFSATTPTSGGSLELDSTTTGSYTALIGVQAAPEPSSLVLLGTGVIGVLGAVRRRLV